MKAGERGRGQYLAPAPRCEARVAGAAVYIIAPGKLGRGGSHVGRNLSMGLRGNQPSRQRLATSRNRVLRGTGVTRAAKRTQGVRRPRDSASKNCMMVGGPRSLCQRGEYRGAVVARRQGPTGVKERGIRTMGSPRNLGGPVLSIHKDRLGHTAERTSPGPREPRSCPWERNEGAGMVLPSEGNEARRDGGGKSQLPNSTWEAGERTRADPVEGRGKSELRNRRRERCRRH